MNSYKILIISFLGLVYFSSCTDPIKLDLKDAAPRIIIEGSLNMTDQTARVLFSKSNGFYDEAVPVYVPGAVVTLQNEDAGEIVLTETGPGIYEASDIVSHPDEIWTIKVESEGVTYTASATAPHPVVLDSIYSELIELPFGGEDDVRIYIEWTDKADVPNFYRLRFFSHDELIPNSYGLLNDEFVDGDDISIPVQGEFGIGEEAKIQLLSCDQEYYQYFLEISSIAGGNFGESTPYNPTGNFDNDALGYFGIFSLSEKEIQL